MNPLDIFPNANAYLTEGARAIPERIRPMPLVLTVEEAAERLGVGRSLMYALVKSGDVESVTIGRLRRIPADALDTFLAGLRQGRADAGGVA